MSDCEEYGINHGCDINYPVLIAGKCELQDNSNKELYELSTKNNMYEN